MKAEELKSFYNIRFTDIAIAVKNDIHTASFSFAMPIRYILIPS
jgi:hypothetical protein